MVNKIKNYGQIKDFEGKSEILLPIGHYIIINCKNNPNNIQPKISIYGLGSCIALILFDHKNKVSGISHILLPRARKNKTTNFPHKYADLSAKLLLQELMNYGAMKDEIKAILVGGSKIFDLKANIMGGDNIKAIKEELNLLKIDIIGEETGGFKGRVFKFDTKDFSVYVKSTGQRNYKKI